MPKQKSTIPQRAPISYPVISYVIELFSPFSTRWGLYQLETYRDITVKALWSTHPNEGDALEAKAQAERGEHYMQKENT